MKARAAELRAEGRKGAKKADGLQAVLDVIGEMPPEDRAIAERVHVAVTANAPGLTPKTWYGMPAYANADGKVVVLLPGRRASSTTRYSALGFQDSRATSTTATCGRPSFALASGAPRWRSRSQPSSRRRSPDGRGLLLTTRPATPRRRRTVRGARAGRDRLGAPTPVPTGRRDVVRHLVECPWLHRSAATSAASGPSVDDDPVGAWRPTPAPCKPCSTTPPRLPHVSNPHTGELRSTRPRPSTPAMSSSHVDLARSTGQDDPRPALRTDAGRHEAHRGASGLGSTAAVVAEDRRRRTSRLHRRDRVAPIADPRARAASARVDRARREGARPVLDIARRPGRPDPQSSCHPGDRAARPRSVRFVGPTVAEACARARCPQAR